MTDTPTPASAPRAPLWMKIALAVSVALNLAVVGMAGGAAWRFHSDGGPRGPVRDLGFGPFSEALAPADRSALRQKFFDSRGDFREARREMRADFAAMLAALRAEPFDAAALQAVLDRQRVRGAEMAEVGSRLLGERIAGMTPEERRAFADRLENNLTRRGHHGDRRDRHGGPHE
ncbi:periplasmic heavy metal sensor [Cereibacter sphaeroides]|uniref:periplasmic heavy metal sensor n=1 Tax=Cereibacter sphaeroides TaxID=1063 RepID=UPI001F4742F4|nr:periplasmic heavy metal sensor [Cereibacter sphaeroides]MCE6957821.1 periplasmic heavy metal sensor [Cereibacter sphaeroides]MCE6969525.1 periplasmic heavy metal sensor [Cereibacter sphaeroides]MCE6972717.1 periplasmic heavy metal sensor [Cereibacter sphaeroides]